MSEEMEAIYTVQIQRRSTEFEIINFKIPEDDFGKKMLSLMFYEIAEHLDPAAGGDGE